jgi:hypothetical protein
VVDGVALARERAEAGSLGEIAVEIGPGRTRVPGCDQRQVLTEGRLFAEEPQEPELRGPLIGPVAVTVFASAVIKWRAPTCSRA